MAKRKRHNLEYRRRKNRRKNVAKFGLTVEGYDRLLLVQDHRCAICTRPTTDFPRRLAIDHHHKTGQVRGLLCASCNVGLGMFQDSQELLMLAAEYLGR